MLTQEIDAVQGALAHIGLASHIEVMGGEPTVQFTVPLSETEDQARWYLEKVREISTGYYALNIDIPAPEGEPQAAIRVMKNKLDAAALWVV